MENTILKVPAEISRIQTMADKGLRLFVDTQEIGSEDAGKVMMLKDKLGWFVFAEQGILEEDIKNLPKIELEEGEKAPSARLRATLYVYWEQHKIAEQFDIYYRRMMEKFINSVKEKLN
jgi:hypothetical protein